MAALQVLSGGAAGELGIQVEPQPLTLEKTDAYTLSKIIDLLRHLALVLPPQHDAFTTEWLQDCESDRMVPNLLMAAATLKLEPITYIVTFFISSALEDEATIPFAAWQAKIIEPLKGVDSSRLEPDVGAEKPKEPVVRTLSATMTEDEQALAKVLAVEKIVWNHA